MVLCLAITKENKKVFVNELWSSKQTRNACISVLKQVWKTNHIIVHQTWSNNHGTRRTKIALRNLPRALKKPQLICMYRKNDKMWQIYQLFDSGLCTKSFDKDTLIQLCEFRLNLGWKEKTKYSSFSIPFSLSFSNTATLDMKITRYARGFAPSHLALAKRGAERVLISIQNNNVPNNWEKEIVVGVWWCTIPKITHS